MISGGACLASCPSMGPATGLGPGVRGPGAGAAVATEATASTRAAMEKEILILVGGRTGWCCEGDRIWEGELVS